MPGADARAGAARAWSACRGRRDRGVRRDVGDAQDPPGQVGISDVRAGLLPQDKAAAIGDLQARGARVLLAGDGINDAPALATAHTGVAMGRAGSDLALDTADAVVITALVTWDLAGHLPLPLGVLGHQGSTVVVGLNGLRLLRAAAWRRAIAVSHGTLPRE